VGLESGHPLTKKLDPCEILGSEVQDLRGCFMLNHEEEWAVSAQILNKKRE
jgi:hypothetical protein